MRNPRPRARRASLAMRAGTAFILLLVLSAGPGCTPEQFQQWWTGLGNPALAEPQLSEAAAGATRFWEEVARRNAFASTVAPVDSALAARMTPSSWRPGCPVPLSDLRYLTLSYVGFDGAAHTGELVVHADAVDVAVAAFKAMWDERFPIDSMRLVDDFGGNDAASMAADNTSGFNCRAVAGSSRWSQHAYGRAIDINPLRNPYVSDGVVEPPGGAGFVDRRDARPGMLLPGAVPVSTFKSLGWGWGGSWSGSKDYQHLSASGR